MKNLLNPFILVPMLVAPAEMLVMVYLSRRRMERRFIRVLGSYVFFVSICLVFGYVFWDKSGFSFVPVMVIANPWAFIINRLSIPSLYHSDPLGNLGGIVLGSLFNCILFYIIGKASYPKDSAEISGQQSDVEETSSPCPISPRS